MRAGGSRLCYRPECARIESILCAQFRRARDSVSARPEPGGWYYLEVMDLTNWRQALASADPSQRMRAVKAALERSVPETVPELAALLDSETHPAVLAACAVAVGKLGGAAHGRRLLPLLRHAEPHVRAGAIAGLEATGVAAFLPQFIALLADGDDHCRAAAARAVRAHGPANQRVAARLMLEKGDAAMQVSAAAFLGLVPDPAVLPIVQLALASPHQVVRDRARVSLQRLNEKGVPGAAELLARVGGQRQARSEKDLLERLAQARLVETAPSTAGTQASSGVTSAAAPESTPAEVPGPSPAASVAVPAPIPSPVPVPMARRKSEEEALAAISEAAGSPVDDLDFLARRELRESAARDRLAGLSGVRPQAAESTEGAAGRAARLLENLRGLTAGPEPGMLPQQREREQMAAIRDRLERSTAGLAGARTAAEAHVERVSREDAMLARLRALSGVEG